MGTEECLIRLLSDEASRDLILDDEALLMRCLERRGCLRITTRFYFYILVRHVFLRSDIQDRSVADYVAEVLAEFARVDGLAAFCQVRRIHLIIFFEMLSALRTGYVIGPVFSCGYIWKLFAIFVRCFSGTDSIPAEARGFPDVRYYEDLGRAHYRLASDHRLAQRYEMAEILGTLSERFETMRLALNDIADRLFSIGDPDFPLEGLLGLKKEDTE